MVPQRILVFLLTQSSDIISPFIWFVSSRECVVEFRKCVQVNWWLIVAMSPLYLQVSSAEQICFSGQTHSTYHVVTYIHRHTNPLLCRNTATEIHLPVLLMSSQMTSSVLGGCVCFMFTSYTLNNSTCSFIVLMPSVRIYNVNNHENKGKNY